MKSLGSAVVRAKRSGERKSRPICLCRSCSAEMIGCQKVINHICCAISGDSVTNSEPNNEKVFQLRHENEGDFIIKLNVTISIGLLIDRTGILVIGLVEDESAEKSSSEQFFMYLALWINKWMFDAVRLTLINGIYCQQKSDGLFYWQKYLTLQHYVEWTCFVKFLFRIYAFRPVLSLREWLIDYAASLLARYVRSHEINFLHNNPSDPKREVVEPDSVQLDFVCFDGAEKTPNLMQIREILIIHSLASDIGNWKRLCCRLRTCAEMPMMNHMTWHWCRSWRHCECRSGIMMPFFFHFGIIHRKMCRELFPVLLLTWLGSEKFPLRNNGMILINATPSS